MRTTVVSVCLQQAVPVTVTNAEFFFICDLSQASEALEERSGAAARRHPSLRV